MKIRNTEADTSAIAFRCKPELRAAIERQAAIEGMGGACCHPRQGGAGKAVS
jgi:hypothetical protein